MMTTWESLINEIQRLSKIAHKIQLFREGEPQLGVTNDDFEKFTTDYLYWYSKSLSFLPEDLKKLFRQEYEKNIGNFLQSPIETDEDHENRFGETIFLYPLWKVEKALFAQRQMLYEASARSQQSPNSQVDTITREAIATIELIARRFHAVIHQLSQRHEARPSFGIADEYDVQDLFHALLVPFFDDIRAEEGAPSHAGKNSRIDFLLKSEKIVVEIKKTRRGLTAKKVGEELTIDKAYYRIHPDCKIFIAFVYDPERCIKNPKGLEHDLSQSEGSMLVKVIITQS